jgi:enediyne biosynthesis protein E4
MLKILLASLLLSSSAVIAFAVDAGPIIPKFVEETKIAGIDSTYKGDWEYMVGGGVATFDCDGDGFADMLLSGGVNRAKFYRNASKQGGVLKFKPESSGLEIDKVTGTYPIDIDSDGVMDLVLLRQGENLVMRGLGNCKFKRANEAWGFDGGEAWSTSFAAIWEKGAKWPTLAIGNYINPKDETSPWGSCTDNWLHRATDKKFTAPFPLKPSFCALSMLFTDWNKSGTPSLRVSNDREYYEGGQEQLWHVEAGKPPVPYTEAEGWKPLKIWGMGIASTDLDGDGYPEYFLTSMADHKLQTLSAAPSATFKDIAFAKGVTVHRPTTGTDLKPSTGWHAQFEDVNNDGLQDLFVAKGNVDRMPDFAAKDPNNLLLQAADGKFTDVADQARVASVASSRGAAMVDFNNDGLLDLVVVNRNDKAQLWRNNTTNLGHWLQIKLRQPAINRDGIGAWIEVKQGEKIMRREITSGGGHASGQNGWWHFGVGELTMTQARVIWPDGTAEGWQNVISNKFYIFERTQPAKLWAVN